MPGSPCAAVVVVAVTDSTSWARRIITAPTPPKTTMAIPATTASAFSPHRVVMPLCSPFHGAVSVFLAGLTHLGDRRLPLRMIGLAATWDTVCDPNGRRPRYGRVALTAPPTWPGLPSAAAGERERAP